MTNLPEDVKIKKERPQAGKPYAKPQIQVYGDIREITHTVGKAGVGDGGQGTGQKTTP